MNRPLELYIKLQDKQEADESEIELKISNTIEMTNEEREIARKCQKIANMMT